jgi:hypothetical protein
LNIEPDWIVNRSMLYKVRILLSLFFLFSVAVVFAQEQELMNGIVVDSATFAPLPFVSIRVKGTYRGTSADVQGKFGVMATRKDTLVLSLIGYETIEIPLVDWEASVIRLAERPTMLKSITIEGTEINPYEGLFDEENERWKKSHRKLPFYYSRWKKEKINLGRARQENLRAQTYVDVIIKNPETKDGLMKKYKLSEMEYYSILTRFNEKNHTIMYYLTAPELLTLLNNFYSRNAPEKD